MTDIAREARQVQVPMLANEMPAKELAAPALRELATDLARAYGGSDDLVERVRLAVTEAVTNVVLHAYLDGESGMVHFAADVEEDALEIVVSDHGHGFRDHSERGPGYGLVLIAVNSDDSTVREFARGVEVWMRFDLK